MAAGEADAALEPCAALPRDQMRRYGVEDFVGDDEAAPARGQNVDPFDAREQCRRSLAQAVALPRGEIGADFEQAIALRQAAAHPARSADRRQAGRCRAPVRSARRPADAAMTSAAFTASAAANSGVISGAVTKSPAAPNLRAPGRVIAESRRVQHGAHVIGKGYPAAGLGDQRGHVRNDLLAVRARFDRRLRQSGTAIAVWSSGHRCDRLVDSRECSRSAACRAKWS